MSVVIVVDTLLYTAAQHTGLPSGSLQSLCKLCDSKDTDIDNMEYKSWLLCDRRWLVVELKSVTYYQIDFPI